jgi:poly(3-hydroxybutyrate) depolymerase
LTHAGFISRDVCRRGNGGNFGQEYPDLYAAVGVHSGSVGVASDLASAMTMDRRWLRAVGKYTQPSSRCSHYWVPWRPGHCSTPSNGKAVHTQARRPTRRVSPLAASTAPRSGKTRSAEGPGGRAFTRTSDTRDGVAEAELWIVHGAGHAWAGGSADGTYTDTVGPDASREMIRFFLQHRLAPEMMQR